MQIVYVCSIFEVVDLEMLGRDAPMQHNEVCIVGIQDDTCLGGGGLTGGRPLLGHSAEFRVAQHQHDS